MLVLTRKLNEQIVIDGEIKITVVRIGRNEVKIGVEAPKFVAVHRKEVQDLIDCQATAT